MATSGETQGQEKKPDSKDFVEHLRTVHFTLVTVCLALVVILQFPSPVPIREAIRQLNTIIDVTNQWKTNWLGVAMTSQFGQDKDFVHCVTPLPAFATVTNKGKHISAAFSADNWTIRKPDLTAIPSQFKDGVKKETEIKQPQRLDEFIDTWNTKYSVICPLRIAEEGVDRYRQTESHPEAAVFQLKKEPISPSSIKVMASLADGTINTQFRGLHTQQNVESKGLYYMLNAIPPKVATMAEIRSFENFWQDLATFSVPVLESRVFLLDFKTWMADNFPQHHWLHADFKDAFYELDQATTGFQDLDFDHLKKVLQQNEKNSKEVFQAFGITFPIETTTRWGILIIISIQLYLWMHLAEFRRQHFAKSTSAWIGTYSNYIPRSIFSLTAVIIPVGVVTYILFFQKEAPLPRHIYSDGVLLITCLLAGLTEREHSKFVTFVTPTNP